MPKIRYMERKFSNGTLATIARANLIIEEYAGQGYDLTLRQLYYQFVSRDLIANKQTEYKRLGSIINDARLAGLIDWNAITDRTRNLASLATWDSPATIVNACASQFRVDMWANQPHRPEVWIEKEALAGVFQRVCEELRIPYFACRGYTSQSEMWSAAQRLRSYERNGQTPFVIHFGDHDPSGIDMSRDIRERLEMFGLTDLEFKRVALNMDQIEEYDPPPNPAKDTDARFAGYLDRFGDESWELDALEPSVLSGIVREIAEGITDEDVWQEAQDEEQAHRDNLLQVALKWDAVTDFVTAA